MTSKALSVTNAPAHTHTRRHPQLAAAMAALQGTEAAYSASSPGLGSHSAGMAAVEEAMSALQTNLVSVWQLLCVSSEPPG